MVEAVLAFESINELDMLIQKELKWTKEDSLRFLNYEDYPTENIILKEREWIPPSEGRNKLIEFLKNKLEAKRLQNVQGKMRWAIPRRMAEVSETAPNVSNEQDSNLEETRPAKTITVNLTQLQFGVFSPRKTNKKWIEHLKEAIQAEGVQSFPSPKVRPHPDNGKMAELRYQLVDGEHFCRALQELGIKEVKIEVLSLTDQEADCKAMRFNQIHGKPLEPVEEARHLKKMMSKYGLSQEQVGERFKRSRQWVSARLNLLRLDENIATRVAQPSTAREVARAPKEDHEVIADKVEREGLSVKATQAVVQAIKEDPEKKEQVLTKQGPPKLTRCGFPGCMKGAYFPTFYGKVPVCPDCDKKIQEDPSLAEKLKEKPSVPERTTKKTYDPLKPTWEERQAAMHPKESKMDWEMFELLKNDPKVKEHGYTVEFQKEYILLTTISDVTLVKDGDEIAVYWDHKKTHKNRENRDAYLRGLLEKRHHGTRAVGFDYKDNTKKSVEELLRKVHGELR